jgi:hypothetical protein
MDFRKLPKDEDVTEFDLGGGKSAKLVEIKPENQDYIVDMMLAQYITEKCRYCEHVYESVQDIRARKVVYAGPYMLACKECFDTNNPAAVSGD